MTLGTSLELFGADKFRCLQCVTNGETPENPDTPEEAEFREELARDIAKMRAKGITIEIPNEIPSI